jgi:large repetitive protein
MNSITRVRQGSIVAAMTALLVLASAGYGAAIPLTNGVPAAGLSGTTNSDTFYAITVPADQTKLEISITGGTGDCDLYVKRDAMPTTSVYDYRPYLKGNDEKVSITNPAAGTWYIMLQGYNAYTGLTLLGAYSGDVGTLLTNGVAVTGIGGLANSDKFYRIQVPTGQLFLEVQITGGSGDCDLYVKRGAAPTLTSWDYRPFVVGNEETVDVNNPTADTWYIMLHGYSDYSSLTLKATYSAVNTLTDGVAVTGLAGALNSAVFYKLDVPTGCSQLVFSTSGGTGNCDLYVKRGAVPTTSVYDYRPYLSGNSEAVTIANPQDGTWYVMLVGRAAYTGVTLLGDYSVASTVRTLSNGVPVTALTGADGSETLFQIVVPSGQTSLEIKITGGSGDCDLYVKRDAAPTLSSFDYRPFLPGNEETVLIPNPTAGTWFVMLNGYDAYSGLTLTATYSGSGGGDTDVTILTNGVAVTGLTGAVGNMQYFKIAVPADQNQISFVMSGGTGDADMYIRAGSKPTETQYDYRPFNGGNSESISISNPVTGTWYVMLMGRAAYSGVTLKVTYVGPPAGVVDLVNGVPVTNLTGAQDSLRYFRIVVPSGQDYLHIATSGGTGDADMYVRKGALPTQTNWDYVSDLPGNTETIDISHPAAASWYILIRGYWAYSGPSLVASYGVTTPAWNIYSTDPNCVAVWNLDPNALTTDSRSTNTLTNVGVTSNTTDFRQGTGSAVFEQLNADSLRIVDANLSAKFPTKSGHAVTVFSGACWVKLNSYTATSYIMSKYMPPSQMSWGLGVLNNGMLLFRIGYGSAASTEFQVPVSTNILQLGRWYHVAFAYTDSTKSCYVRVYDKTADSVIINETLHFVNNMSVSTSPFVLGGTYWADPSYSLDGQLDEVAIFNDILTSAQIDQIRQGTYGHP